MSAVPVRNRHALDTSSVRKPSAKALTVSAAAMFKKRKLDTSKLTSRTRNPRGSNAEQFVKNTHVKAVHPLSLAFRETSEEYRRHLYATAVTKVKNDLNTLLDKLYKSNLQVVSSDSINDNSHASSLKLTIPAKYQQLTEKLCTPLSGQQRISITGDVERVPLTLHDRFKSFEEKTRLELEEIATLQGQWEGIIAEIFQLGVACLGEVNVAALLTTAEIDADKAESAPLISEHGSPVCSRGEGDVVSFAGPNMAALFPGFLMQTSGQRKSIPANINLPAEDVQRLEQAIAELGKEQVLELQRLETEHQAWWKKKQTQLAHTFLQD